MSESRAILNGDGQKKSALDLSKLTENLEQSPAVLQATEILCKPNTPCIKDVSTGLPSNQLNLIQQALERSRAEKNSTNSNPYLETDAPEWKKAILAGQLPPLEPLVQPKPAQAQIPKELIIGNNIEQIVAEAKRARPADSIHTIKDIKNELSLTERDTLDVLLVERAACTGTDERASKEKQITNFLRERLGETISKAGYEDVFKNKTLTEALDGIKGKGVDGKDYTEHIQRILLDRAAVVIKNPAHLADFTANLANFRNRATAAGLPETSVAETLTHISRVLDPARLMDPTLQQKNGDAAITALGMMRNAADPTAIDQGGHNTCNVNTVECRLYTREPHAAVKVVADVAINGFFTTADNTVVTPRTLTPDGEATPYPTPDGWRNYASQIFQVTAINIHWNRTDTLPGGKVAGKGNISYCQGGNGEPPEYLLNTSKFPPEIHRFNTIDSNHPWLNMPQMSDINSQITGKPSVNFGIGRSVVSSESDGCIKVSSLDEFKERLAKLATERAFPIIVEVDAAKKPMGTGDGFGPHVATITHYDPLTGMVTVDNQWGKGNDMTDKPGEKPRVSVSDLYDNMDPLPSAGFLWGQFKENLDGIGVKDAVNPAISTLSLKVAAFGTFGTAPTLLRSGLDSMSKAGVPGTASMLAASQTRLGRIGTRTGTALGAIGLAMVASDLHSAFREGTGHGIGKLTRVTTNFGCYEVGSAAGRGIARLTTLNRWAPGRAGLAITAGLALAAVVDRVGGEGIEVGAAELYQDARKAVGGWFRK